MLSKNELKYYSSLLQKKYRKQENKFLIEGKKLVEESLKSNYETELIVFTREFFSEHSEFINRISKASIRLEQIRAIEFQRFSDTRTPQGIAAVLKMKQPADPDKLKLKNEFALYLEDISDPGNLGTILRTADWFGITDIILSPDSAEIYNPKVLRSSMGSVFHLNLFTDFPVNKLIKFTKEGYNVLCADKEGIPVFGLTDFRKKIICFGNEAKGISDQLQKISSGKITIPGKGKAESLNVAAAAAVILAQVFIKLNI
ncbi:MAG: RNA methyltransferase [Ignavibacteriaceae bacterium]